MARAVEQEKELQRIKALVFDWRALQSDQNDSLSLVRTAHVDPSVNMEILTLRDLILSKDDEIRKLKATLQEAYANPNSIVWGKLVNKLKQLQTENEETAKTVSDAAAQEFSFRLSLANTKTEKVLKKLKEEHEFNTMLDEENEQLGLQVSEFARKLQAAESRISELQERLPSG
eukprot:GHVR01046675.1.p1 GENE.GHVR01046675.1~~GHVR01046675.1.p1  ORF type:complete len:174 (+),score=41.16 GHVR01046675.1:245-766(+)